MKTKAGSTSVPAAPAPGSPAARLAVGAVPPPPPGGPQGPRPGHGPGPEGPGAPGFGRGGVQALSDVSGTLMDFTASGDEQVYDGFSLKTSAGIEAVRFPRHLGQALLAAAKPGSAVTVTGYRRPDPAGGRASLHLVSLKAGPQTVLVTPPTPPATPPAEETTTVRGTVQRLNADPQGRPTGVQLSDGTLLRLPPAAAEQLAEKLKPGATVAATGALRGTHPGEVAAKPVKVVRPQTITVDNVQFLVQ